MFALKNIKEPLTPEELNATERIMVEVFDDADFQAKLDNNLAKSK